MSRHEFPPETIALVDSAKRWNHRRFAADEACKLQERAAAHFQEARRAREVLSLRVCELHMELASIYYARARLWMGAIE